MTPHVPILRHGEIYESVDQFELRHHATGEPVARVSQANAGMITRDVARMDRAALERFSVRELIGLSQRASELFVTATLPLGNGGQTFTEYLRQLSATTGMPIAYCKANAEKIRRVLADVDVVIRGLTRGFDLSILDRGYGDDGGRTLSFYREGRVFGAVLPSNSPGVHGLWAPSVALKAPTVVKPGREEPWTPHRVFQAFLAAGVPGSALGFYPTDHAGARALLESVDRAMLFGDASTTGSWRSDRRVEIHGPGYSKVILGDDRVDDWPRYLELIVTSIAANCGRSCINASAVWTPRNGRAIAGALAERLARVEAKPADDPDASLAAFADATMAERISAMIDQGLREPGAVDLTERVRGSPRLVRRGRCAYLLPTILWCEDRSHPLANREFLFPFASVVECPTREMPDAIGRTLVVSAISDDRTFIRSLMTSSNVDRLNVGPVPTWQLSWDQPHEGNLFEHLYRQRAFQIESAA